MSGERGHVEVEGVSKRFGNVIALNEINLSIPRGKFFSLLGPSGCGKTTLLRALAGLETVDSGRIRHEGAEITGTPPERRPFNMVFQSYALFPHLTVEQNIAFGLTTDRRRRVAKEDRARRVEEALTLVGLSDLGSRMPGELSGGQAQRVAVARAIARQPDVLLLDEPLSAVDRNVRLTLREELARIHRELGTTFLLVTHDQEEALSLSETVALMNHGRIEQIADPETLYRNPINLFAARFVGAGSFVDAPIRVRGDAWVEVEIGGAVLRAQNAGVTGGIRACVLLRPEDLRAVSPEAGAVRGSVETCAFFGAGYEVRVGTPIGALRLRTAAPIEPGTVVGIEWDCQAGIAYDASDGASPEEASRSVSRAISG